MKSFTVLIAEHDLLSRMVLERSVVQWGYQLLTAIDGECARELLERHTVDVCIMSWEMPRRSGIELCRWLRTHGRSNPYVILLTSEGQPDDIQAGYEAGADDYLTRPCDLKYLKRRVATIAEKRQRNEALLEHARHAISKDASVAGLSPLDLYLADIRLMRNKT
jgi:DNA-binding response OmpR family regulator